MECNLLIRADSSFLLAKRGRGDRFGVVEWCSGRMLLTIKYKCVQAGLRILFLKLKSNCTRFIIPYRLFSAIYCFQ